MIMGGGPPFPLDDDSDGVTYAKGVTTPSLIRRLWDWLRGWDLYVTKHEADQTKIRELESWFKRESWRMEKERVQRMFQWHFDQGLCTYARPCYTCKLYLGRLVPNAPEAVGLDAEWTVCGCGYRSECRIHCGDAHQDGSGRCRGSQSIKVEQEWD